VFLGRGLITILPTGFGNSLIFQLFPRLINALQRNVVSKIIVVTLLVAIMKDQASELERWLSEWTKKKTRKEQEKWIG